MTEDFQTLLSRRDHLRAMVSNPEVDSIVIDRLKGQMTTVLRQAIDELSERQPALSRRIDAETEWIRAVISMFAGPDA
jgi:hypothetical protein